LSEVPARRKEALRYIDEALEIAGRQPALLDTKGMIVLDESPLQAIPLLQEACTGLTTDPRFHFHLAVAHGRNNKPDDARLELKRAQSLNLAAQALTPTEQRLLADLKKNLDR
jgi:Flp pilus assembly protein TadD